VDAEDENTPAMAVAAVADGDPTFDDRARILNGRIARYKPLKGPEIIEGLPYNPAGKVRKTGLGGSGR
jgi:hypothetical protein